MGAGKSTVGPIVAKHLAWPFVDTDTWVEEEAGKSVPEIFKDEGEDHFRQWESKAISEICHLSRVVVALGGGALMAKRNQQRVLKSGLLIYLSASVETLRSRLQVNERPLLKGLEGKDLEKYMSDLIQLRLPQYQLAPLVIATDGKTPKTIGLEIINEVSKCKP